MKKTLFTAVLILSVLLVLAGCQKPNHEANLIGTWYVNHDDGYTYTYVFRADYTGVETVNSGTETDDYNFRWLLSGTTLKVTEDGFPDDPYYMTFDGNSLKHTLRSGQTVTYTKQ